MGINHSIGIDGVSGEASDERDIAVVRTTVEASLRRGQELGRPFLDPAIMPHASRLRALGVPDETARGDELVAMATFVVAADGGGMRKFSGGLGHPNGWWSSAKSSRILGFEGMTAFELLQRYETDHDVVRILTEPLTIEFPNRCYTPDFLVERSDGARELVEAKPDERGLADSRYRETLGMTAEVCRRLGWMFHVVLRDDVFRSRSHRRNVELFSDRRFARVQPHHVRTLHALARNASTYEYADLAARLEPSSEPAGKAVIQALHCRRLLKAPLQNWLHDRRPIRMIDPDLIAPSGQRRDLPSNRRII